MRLGGLIADSIPPEYKTLKVESNDKPLQPRELHWYKLQELSPTNLEGGNYMFWDPD